MSLLSLIHRIYKKITNEQFEITFAQTGEDIIVDFLVKAKKIEAFTYLDVGANHPTKFNNTYKFYLQGYRGINIEPDPNLFKLLKKLRKEDLNLNIGIAANSNYEADFYIMETPLLNTFSKQEAEDLVLAGLSKIKTKIKVELKTITQIIESHLNGEPPTLINLDVEGLDEEILRSFPFQKYRPYIFCIETVHYTKDATSGKRVEIINLMKDNGYTIFADTYINTIFIDSKK